ncbi:DNA repair protein RecO [Butyrivibrio fibrisolvens]|uniref:DNA repair protein RecO n=1 Tax=Butyrivibrio fibrisolvens TaxID=831 RepID=UPI001FA7CFB5|nr:DNA repair protein RecO [Butyrivibrio fibrisolvens]
MMKETFDQDNRLTVNGIVIKHRPVGEYDFTVTIITMERGKISAFARGARKPGGKLSGNVEPFCYGTFTLYEGKSSYNIIETDIINYFEPFRRNLEDTCYGTYLLELADYYATENSDETELLKLLYLSLTALTKDAFDKRLVRCIFELRALVIDGQYPGFPENRGYSDAVKLAMQHISGSDLKSLFTFRLSDQALKELIDITRMYREHFVDRQLKSLEILSTVERELV